MLARLKTLWAVVVFLALGVPSLAQDLRVVTVTRTPFSQVENGQDVGFTLELWAEIANELGLGYSIQRVDKFSDMLAAVENSAADVGAANISITAEREERMDFSQPIFASGLRVMVPAEDSGSALFQIIFSRDVVLAVFGAFGLLFAGGMLMWVFERGRQEYFQGSASEKAFPAFWWALNLVVNGGFEERMPRSPFGRIFATLLVVSSLFVVSIFVAKITAAMTVDAIQSSVQSVNDLYGKRVGTTSGSTAAAYMDGRDLRYRGYDDLTRLIEAFEAGELDAVVFDAPILSYYVNTDGAGIGQLVGPTFLREYYGFALAPNGDLREPVDRVLLRFSEDGTYRRIYTKWFGQEEAS